MTPGFFLNAEKLLALLLTHQDKSQFCADAVTISNIEAVIDL